MKLRTWNQIFINIKFRKIAHGNVPTLKISRTRESLTTKNFIANRQTAPWLSTMELAGRPETNYVYMPGDCTGAWQLLWYPLRSRPILSSSVSSVANREIILRAFELHHKAALNRYIIELAQLIHSPFISKIPFLALCDGVSLPKPGLAYGDSAAILRRNLALLRSACTRYNSPWLTSAGRSTDPAVRSPGLCLGLSRSWRAGLTGHVRSVPHATATFSRIHRRWGVAHRGVGRGVLVSAWDFWRIYVRAYWVRLSSFPTFYPRIHFICWSVNPRGAGGKY